MTPLISHPADAFNGTAMVPGDKSISHRALMIAALAIGETTISGLLEGQDVLATAAALSALGVDIINDGGGNWRVHGRGLGGLTEPQTTLDMGNSGTAARLLLGVLAGHPLTATITGDASLNGRPMGRVIEPLQHMGAQFKARPGNLLPLTMTGAADPLPVDLELDVPSAQVKSAILLAGLCAPGLTRVVEPRPTRDHTERMLTSFGAEVAVEDIEDGRRAVTVAGQPELTATDITVPGDISSAAFPLVAALIVPGGKIELTGVGINPLRTGLLDTLRDMGAAISITNERLVGGEPVADIDAAAGRLRGVVVPASRAPSMIDEYPILAVAAAMAEGATIMHGLAELRVKESDRLSAIAKGLSACGVTVEAGDDVLVVHGIGKPPKGGATVAVHMDHRIAMAFLVLGMTCENPVTVDDGTPIETSFPGFRELMNGCGAKIEETRS